MRRLPRRLLRRDDFLTQTPALFCDTPHLPACVRSLPQLNPCRGGGSAFHQHIRTVHRPALRPDCTGVHGYGHSDGLCVEEPYHRSVFKLYEHSGTVGLFLVDAFLRTRKRHQSGHIGLRRFAVVVRDADHHTGCLGLRHYSCRQGAGNGTFSVGDAYVSGFHGLPYQHRQKIYGAETGRESGK